MNEHIDPFAALDPCAILLLRETLSQADMDGPSLPRHVGLTRALRAIRSSDPGTSGDYRATRDALLARAPDLRPHVTLLEQCASRLRDVLAGRALASDVMFPGGGMELVEPVYRGNRWSDHFNRLTAAAVFSAVRARLAQEPGSIVRILEVGAGTGGTSLAVLEALDAHADQVTFDYTDVSMGFVQHGRRVHGAKRAYFKGRVLDLEQAPDAQGFAAESYDIVMGTNVLHATSRIGVSLGHVHRLLRSGGLLLLNEITRAGAFATMTFGLLDGWWAFQDADLRLPDAPVLSPAGWRNVLTRAGFGAPAVFGWTDPPDQSFQCLFVAERPAVAVAAPVLDLRSALADRLAGLLGLDPAELSADRPLAEFGVDSIIAPQFVSLLNRDLGATLVPTDIFNCATLRGLADHMRGMTLSAPDEPVVVAAPEPVVQAAPSDNDIAVIGLACRFPGAADADGFWDNIVAGRNAITEVPPERWDGRADGRVRWGGFLSEHDCFDPEFFNLSWREAEAMSPQQRVFLEQAWHALENAGYGKRGLAGVRCGVFVGAAPDGYGVNETDSLSSLGGSLAILAARISYLLDLRGPSLPVDTACSSSLVAVHLACQSVLAGDCDMALAGGVSILMTDRRLHSFLDDAGMLSPTGQCHTFDTKADGFVPGEGVGVVVLKRLPRALADGDTIIGVIKASGLNQDGRTSGITAPSGPAQSALEAAVHERGGIDPNEITLVEAHGTGTQLGDPIEVNALATTFRQRTDRVGFCALGSVKTNIGHTLTAAGVAGLIKVLLALRHKTIPPSLNFSDGNALIGFDRSPFFVPRQAMPWAVPSRLAAVSSFGFSGTNAHVVVGEAPLLQELAIASGPALILLSARTAEALEARRTELLSWLGRHAPRLSDLAFTLSQGRGHFEHRLAILVDTLDDLRAWRGRVWRAENLILPARGDEDAALAAALADPARDLARIADCYVRGGDADWMSFGGPGVRRIALPGYPFARLRFPTRTRTAVVVDTPRAAVTHPMLFSDGGLVLDPDLPWLRDHQFNGAAVFPAVAYVEAARAAIGAADVSLHDIRLDVPLVARAGASARVVVKDDADGLGFTFLAGDGTVHAFGRAVVGSAGAVPAITDVAAIAAHLPGPHDGEAVYARFRDLGFDYGPGFRVIRSLRSDTKTVLAELAPTAPVRPGLMLDPALLDGAVQAAIGLMLAGTEALGSVVPVAIGRVTIHGAVTGPCLAHVSLLETGSDTRRLRIAVLDRDGSALVTLDDLTVRVAAEAEITFLAPVWEPAQLAEAAAPAAILLFDRDETLWRELGTEAILVRSGSAFCRLEPRCFAIDPDSAEDHARLLSTLRAEGMLPDTVWHLWSRTEPATAVRVMQAAVITTSLRDGLNSIFHLCSAWARMSPSEPVTILHAHAGESPLQAPVAAFAAGLARENPLLQVASVALPFADVRRLRSQLSAETRVKRDVPHERATRWDDSGTRSVRRLRPTAIPMLSEGNLPRQCVVLLTGALGGIGSHVARHLARRYQARIALIGRSPAGPKSEALIADIRAADGDAAYFPADIADEAATEAVVAAARARFGPIQAVIHAAGVTRDRFLLHKTADDLAAVLAPKLAGTIALDRATVREPLVAFVCFSSVAGAFGNAGQTDYSAANRFQDAFMAERVGPGRSLSIGWPYWRDGGLVVDPAEVERRAAATGLRAIETKAAMDVFDTLVGQAEGAILVLPGQRRAVEGFVRGATPQPAAPSIPAGEAPIDAAITYLRRLLASATAMPEARINPDRPLEQYGIDSILVTRMNEELSRDFPGLPRTLFFEHQTLRAAATFLAGRHGSALTAMEGTEASPLPVVHNPAAEGIAIIGIAGRYPGADSLDAFWDNLCADRDLITEIPTDRWNASDWHDPKPGTPGRSYSAWGGFLAGVDQFDPLFFNIAPGEAAAIDPNERLFLETCWEALENAGYTRARLARDPARAIGVYAGVMYGEYQLLAAERAGGQRPVGGSSPYWSVANRVSYHLDLHGPSIALDSACSSSLTAIHLACQAISAGECSAAIAGGVNLSLHPLKYVGLSQGRFAASDGRCHSFAEGGDGYVPGEGVGAVILKPLAAAIADGDFVHAVIRGWAANHGGKTNGYTVPNPVQQAGVIAKALARGGVAPETVSYIEAHGTGTALGDPIEVAGLASAFGDAVPRQSVALGSVKANIGHLEAAAGIAGLTRVVLQLRNRTLTPTHRHGPPNRNIDFAATPFRLQEVTEPWTGPMPLRGGISSFGAGGANAHLVVEEYRTSRSVADSGQPALFVLSARGDAALRAYATRMADFLRRGRYALTDICRTLQCGREPMAARLSFVATSSRDAAERLDRFLAGDTASVRHAVLDDDSPPPAPPADAGLETLAEAWVNGAAIDWPALNLPGEIVPVPPHPFMRRRFWLEDAPSAAAPAPHPFLDRLVPSLDGTVLEKRFRVSEPVIRDHVVRGRCLVPGVVLLEMARAAVAMVSDAPTALRDVVWMAPLLVGTEGAETTISLRRDGEAVAFEIARDGAVLCRGRTDRRAPEPVDRVDIAALRARGMRHLDGSAIYDRLAALGLRYGDSLRVLTDLWSDGGTLVAALAPVAVEEGVILPPAVLDGALQALLGFAAEGATDLLVPFALSAASLSGSLAAARFVVATRREATGDVALFDLTIRDAEGQALLRMDGLAARAAAPARVTPTAPLPLTIRQPVWRVEPPQSERAEDTRVVVAHGGDDAGLIAHLRAALGGGRVRDWRIGGALALDASVSDLIWVAVASDAGGLADRAEAMALDLLHAIRALDEAGWLSAGLTLRIVTRGFQSPTPREKPDPSAAAVLGLGKCIALEYPRVAVTLADFDAATLADPRIADFILGEPATLPTREVAWRAGVRHVQVMQPMELAVPVPPLRAGSVVLIVGGAGGIGAELAAWLARDCSLRVALVGRRSEAEMADRIAAIPCGAGAVRYFQADATDVAAMRQVTQRLRAIWGGVDAAIHAALVLRDRTLARMDDETFRAVLAPKIAGSVALIEALSFEPLRFVAFLSSVNVVSGSLGQSNYVAGSSFVDAYARAVAAEHPWRVVVTDWGLWGDVGVVSGEAYRQSLARLGVHPIQPKEGIAAFASVLAGTADRVVIARAEPEALRRLGLDHEDTLTEAEAAFATLERYGRVRLRDILVGMAGETGKAWTTEGLRRRLAIAPRHDALFIALLHALAEDDLITARDGLWRLHALPPDSARARLDAAQRGAGWLAGPRRLLETCLDAYPALLRGEVDPVSVLFPQASMATVEAAYAGNPIADRFNRAVAEAAREHASAAIGPLRVIELGAGTGSTTAVVLDALASFGDRVTYLATDLSQRFLAHGAARFAGRPGVEFALFDVERDAEANGQAIGTFDIVLAANVLHATANLGRTLARVRRLLRPGGILLLSEATRAQDFGTMVFGLTPGWWLADDRGHRIPHAPLASVESWTSLLKEAGFATVDTVTTGPNSPHALLIATNREVFTTTAQPTAIPQPATRPASKGVATGLTDYLRGVLADVLKLDPEEVRINEGFDQYGLESLTALEIRNRLDRDIPGLPATLLFEHNTLARLAAWLAETHPEAVARLTTAAVPVAPAAPPPTSPPASVVPTVVRPVVPLATPRSFSPDEPIAIIGFAGRYPGGPTPDAFWRLLRAGDSAIGEVPADRWDAAAIYDPSGSEGSSHTKWAGFIPDADRFDPLFFNIAPSDAEMMDPQERVFLETAWAALEQAGYTPARLRERAGGDAPDGGDVGVFVGAMNAPYQWIAAEAWAAGHPNAASTEFWSMANRVSFLLDFSGPSMVVDTACSASLTAIHLACESLRRGECGAALAGGVNLILHPQQFINLSQARMVSRGAECRAFGAGADGFVDGEGVGAVLLKPLSAARRDGDRIEGVILASAVNAGGRTSGFTVPSPMAQARVVRAAIRRSGVAPESISYVEAHGTGTALGDPIEIAGLAEAFGGAATGQRMIGAVKANIGHLEAAAGVAGLTKVLLQLRHRTIAPSRHAGTPNPLIDFASTGFVLPTEAVAWEPEGLRRAGVSSFGAGGANAHLVIEEYPVQAPAGQVSAGPELILLSARDAEQLRVVVGNLLAAIQMERPRLADIAHTLRVGREAMAVRLALLASDIAALETGLAAWLDGGQPAGVVTGSASASARLLAETEEGRAMLAGLLARSDLDRLGRLWVDGADIEWAELPVADVRLIPLPTYPFRRERYWLPTAPRVMGRSHEATPVPDTGAEDVAPAPSDLPSHGPAPTESSAAEQPAVSDQAARTQLFSRTWNRADIQGRLDPMPLLVLSRDRRLAGELVRLWDAPVRLIEAGRDFAVMDDGVIRMDPASDADHAALIAHVARAHPGGFAIVQALDWEADPDHGAGPLATILLTQAAQRGAVSGVRILHLFAQADGRPLDQAVGALARSAMQESDGCRLRAVGFADPIDAVGAAAICRDEILANDDAPEVLYRSAVRQTPGIEPVAVDPSAATIGFRIGGAYLLVGGLGEVGCAIAERLGRDYRARIAIIGRSDPRGPALERLRGLRDAGIQVHYEACDLTDRAGLDQALSRIRAALGRLHGVLHLARTVEDALLVRKSAASVGRVMAAKVAGSITLDAALNGEELDWFVLCSSLAAWLGLAGGGDYALACAFQSGFARLRQQKVERGERAGRTVAICWPQWRHDRYLNDAKLRRLAAEGLQTIDARDGLRIIAQALQSESTEVAAVKGTERALARVPMAYRQDTAPVVARVGAPSVSGEEPESDEAEDEVLAELRGLSDNELAAYLDYLDGDTAPSRGRIVSGEPVRDAAARPPAFQQGHAGVTRHVVAPSPPLPLREGAGGRGIAARTGGYDPSPRPPPSRGGVASVPLPTDTPEQAVLDTVCEFLKLPRNRFTEVSEFAAFGMDSIKALHVAERLQKRLGVTVDPTMFYEYPTVAALAQALAAPGTTRPARIRP